MNYICSINDYVCTALYLFHSLTFIFANPYAIPIILQYIQTFENKDNTEDGEEYDHQNKEDGAFWAWNPCPTFSCPTAPPKTSFYKQAICKIHQTEATWK